MNPYFLAISVIAGLMALIPSKLEAERPIPWPSLGLAILSGIMAGLTISVAP